MTEPVLVLDWRAIAGSGFVVAVLFLALVERLRRTFATRDDLNGLGGRVTSLQTLFLQLRETVDELRDRTTALQTEQRHQWERVAERVINPLERINEKLESVTELQAAQRTALEHIEKRLDRANGHRPSGPRREGGI